MPTHIAIKDHFRETRILTNRIIAAVIAIVLLTSILLGRLFYLQISLYEHFGTLSDKNRIQIQAAVPTRGLIYDRNGILIADNQPSFSLVVTKELVDDMDTMLARINSLIQLKDNDLEKFHKRLKNRRRPFEKVPLHQNLTEEEIAIIAVNQHELPGVGISAELIRHYPYDDLFSHVIGYVNRINKNDLQNLEDPPNYVGSNYIGRLGVEQFYESLLHGMVGYQEVETDARGQLFRVISREDPIPGADLTLFLDVKTQQAATRAMAGKRGAVVAIDVVTGGIISFVSTPTYNPNLFVTGISTKDYNNYRDSIDKPLYNRVLRGQYPPGSTVKPIIGLAAVENKILDWQYTINDKGFYQLENDNHKYRDWKKRGHGKMTLHDSIVQSCDVFFYDLSYQLGIDKMSDFLSHFGLGKKTGIDLFGEQPGILPSREWKIAFRGERWYHGETLITGIGQGFMLTTPLQLATATAMMANKGRRLEPALLKNTSYGYVSTVTSKQVFDEASMENWTKVQAAMEDVVHGERGTARIVGRKAKYRIAGKTGTAQVFSVAQDEEYDEKTVAERLKDHALFIAYAPADDPKIAVAVIVENGSHGGSTAGPVARKVLDAYLLDAPLPDET